MVSEQTIQLFIDSPLGIGWMTGVAVNQVAMEVLGSDDPILNRILWKFRHPEFSVN
jgi:hypothetical protein